MKFTKLSLDESLFGDELNWVSCPQNSDIQVLGKNDYDDEFVGTDLPEDIMEGPESGSDTGVTDVILDAIHDELEAISTYNSIIETLKFESLNNSEYTTFIPIIQDIVAEENKHVGQLQEILTRLSPNAKMIDVGREEGKQQFKFTDGLLQVQSWNTTPTSNDTNTVNDFNDQCTLTDIDDDM